MNIEPFNPRLSDFDEEQLMEILALILEKAKQVQTNIDGYKLYPSLERMMADKIADGEKKIVSLGQIGACFIGAIQVKQKENQIVNN